MPIIPPTAATQVVYPWKAAVRTVVQGLLSFAALFSAVLVIPGFHDLLNVYLPEGWPAYVYGFGVFVAAFAGVLARVMALPQLQAFLTSVHLGAVPKHLAQ
jgi:hypothetical protein